MEKEIKVTRGATITKAQMDRIIENPNTINLIGKLSTRQMKQKRELRKAKRDELPVFKFVLSSILFILVLIGAILNTGQTEAFFWTEKETPIEAVIDREEYCNNYLIRADYDRYKSECKEYHKVTKDILDDEQGYYNTIKWGKYNQPIIVWDTRVNYMIEQKYSLTEVIDVVALGTMECNRYDGKCMNGTSDIGPMQINRIAHKQAYLRSKELFYNSAALFKYQLGYIKVKIYDDLNDRFCGWQYATTNKQRFKCLAKNYNGNKAIASNGKQVRENYADLAWEKRKQIARYIVDNYPLLTN